MTRASVEVNEVTVRLSREEALVLFEWLSRNWEATGWTDDEMFSDPAEKQLLIWLENDLAKLLTEPFQEDYQERLRRAYRQIVAHPADW